MEDEPNKKIKIVMGELSRTDVLGAFTVDRATKAGLVNWSKVWEIK